MQEPASTSASSSTAADSAQAQSQDKQSQSQSQKDQTSNSTTPSSNSDPKKPSSDQFPNSTKASDPEGSSNLKANDAGDPAPSSDEKTAKTQGDEESTQANVDDNDANNDGEGAREAASSALKPTEDVPTATDTAEPTKPNADNNTTPTMTATTDTTAATTGTATEAAAEATAPTTETTATATAPTTETKTTTTAPTATTAPAAAHIIEDSSPDGSKEKERGAAKANRTGVAHHVPLSRSPSEEGSEPELSAPLSKPGQNLLQTAADTVAAAEKDKDDETSAKTRSTQEQRPQVRPAMVSAVPAVRSEGQRHVGGPFGMRKLALSGQGLTDDALASIIEKQDGGGYLEVDISRNLITSGAANSLLKLWEASPDLRVLKLFNNQLGDAIGDYFRQLFRLCPEIEEIHLSHNHLTERGAETIVTAAVANLAPARGALPARPLWLRLEHNRFTVPSEDFARQMAHRYRSICLREDTRKCTNRSCIYSKRIHLPFIVDRQKGTGKGSFAPIVEERHRGYVDVRARVPYNAYNDVNSSRRERPRSRSRSERGRRDLRHSRRSEANMQAHPKQSSTRRHRQNHERSPSHRPRRRKQGQTGTTRRRRETRKGLRHRGRASTSSSSSSSSSSSYYSSADERVPREAKPSGRKAKPPDNRRRTTDRAVAASAAAAAAPSSENSKIRRDSPKPPAPSRDAGDSPVILVETSKRVGKTSILKSRAEVEADRRAVDSSQRKGSQKTVADPPEASVKRRRREATTTPSAAAAPPPPSQSKRTRGTANSKAKAKEAKPGKRRKKEAVEDGHDSEYTYSYYSYYAYDSDSADGPAAAAKHRTTAKSSARGKVGGQPPSQPTRRLPAPSAAPGFAVPHSQVAQKASSGRRR